MGQAIGARAGGQAASLDEASGETRGAGFASDRGALHAWVDSFDGRLGRIAIEATTGWLWIARELIARGLEVCLLDPGEASARKGRKRRAKTDRLDARFLLSLLASGMAPEAWLPPEEICELRTLTRTRKALVDERTRLAERAQALLFHEGWPCRRGQLLTASGRRWVEGLKLSPPVRLALQALLRSIDELARSLAPLEEELARRARSDARLRVLQGIFGVGPIVACHLLAEIGDARRFRRSRHVVRLSGLDPVVYESGESKRRGRLAKAGPPLLRWAVVEAAQHARRRSSPDHERWQRISRRRGVRIANLAAPIKGRVAPMRALPSTRTETDDHPRSHRSTRTPPFIEGRGTPRPVCPGRRDRLAPRRQALARRRLALRPGRSRRRRTSCW